MQVTIPVVQPIIPFNPKIQPLMLSTIGRTSTTSDADVTKFSPPPTIPQNAPILKKSEVKSPSLQVGTPTGSTSHLTTPQVKPPRRPTPEIEPRWIFMDPAQDSHQKLKPSELPNKTNMGEFTDVPPMEVTQNAEVHHLNTPVLPNCSAIAEGDSKFFPTTEWWLNPWTAESYFDAVSTHRTVGTRNTGGQAPISHAEVPIPQMEPKIPVDWVSCLCRYCHSTFTTQQREYRILLEKLIENNCQV